MTGKKSSIDGADAKTRKAHPLTTGVLDYFPDALLAVAECSRLGNEQHNPGQPLHWAKEKSTDHADCITRHLLDRGGLDNDGVRHSAKVAWRALALLQTEIEDAESRRKIGTLLDVGAAAADGRLVPRHWVGLRTGPATRRVLNWSNYGPPPWHKRGDVGRSGEGRRSTDPTPRTPSKR